MPWPGGALQENQPWQWVEGEFVKPDEYDEMLANPNLFSIFKFWPRISRAMAPLGEPALMKLPPLTFVTSAMALPPFLGGLLSQPQSVCRYVVRGPGPRRALQVDQIALIFVSGQPQLVFILHI